MMNESHRTLLTSTQAGRLLGVSGKTVLRMAEREEVHVVAKLPGINGPRLFEADEIQRLALKQAIEKPSDQEELQLGLPTERKASLWRGVSSMSRWRRRSVARSG